MTCTQFGYKKVDNSDINKETITNSCPCRPVRTFEKHPGSGNLFWDWWTLMGTGWYQRHTRKMILNKKKVLKHPENVVKYLQIPNGY